MKKIALMASVVAVAMSWTACDSFELPRPQAPVNPQEPVFTTDELTIAPLDGEVLNLADYQGDTAEPAKVANLTLNNWPAGYDVNMMAQVSATPTFEKYTEVQALAGDGEVLIDGKLLNDAVAEQCGKEPVERTVYLRYSVTADRNGLPEFIIGGPGFFFGPEQLKVMVYSPYELASKYYIHINGGAPIEMTQGSDANVYDDPNFSYLDENVPNGGYTFYITAEGQPNVYYYGTVANRGTLEAGNAPQQTPVTLSEKVLLKVNVETMHYEAVNAYETLYVANNTPGHALTKPLTSPVLMTTDFVTYEGFAYLSEPCDVRISTNSFKTYWGMGDKEGTLKASGANIPVAEAGFYYVKVNLVALTYSFVEVTSIGILGDATEAVWDVENPVELAPANEERTIWSVVTTLTAGKKIKVNTNHSWGINLGGAGENPTVALGAPVDLQFNAGDIETTDGGLVTVTLDCTQNPYTLSIAAQ